MPEDSEKADPDPDSASMLVKTKAKRKDSLLKFPSLNFRKRVHINPTVKRAMCCGKSEIYTSVDLSEKLEGLRNALGDDGELSYAGMAAYEALRHHGAQLEKCWDVTTGRTVGSIRWTPKDLFEPPKPVIDLPMTRTPAAAPEDHRQAVPDDAVTGNLAHDQHFPKRLGELIAMTEFWCDVTSLDPPDGMYSPPIGRLGPLKYIGIADGMSTVRVWACRYSK